MKEIVIKVVLIFNVVGLYFLYGVSSVAIFSPWLAKKVSYIKGIVRQDRVLEFSVRRMINWVFLTNKARRDIKLQIFGELVRTS